MNEDFKRSVYMHIREKPFYENTVSKISKSVDKSNTMVRIAIDILIAEGLIKIHSKIGNATVYVATEELRDSNEG